MFDICEVDVGAYNFVYPAKEIIKAEFKVWIKRKKYKDNEKDFNRFIIPFVKERVQIGFNRLKELEPEWEKLYSSVKTIEKEYSAGKIVAVEKAIIIYDYSLQLFYEGYPLPPNITY